MGTSLLLVAEVRPMRPYPVTQVRVQPGHHGQTGLHVQQRVEVEPSIGNELNMIGTCLQ